MLGRSDDLVGRRGATPKFDRGEPDVAAVDDDEESSSQLSITSSSLLIEDVSQSKTWPTSFDGCEILDIDGKAWNMTSSF